MICTNCGTEIADKALICYKCGNATTAPRVAPPARRKRRSRTLYIALLIIIVLALLVLWKLGATPP